MAARRFPGEPRQRCPRIRFPGLSCLQGCRLFALCCERFVKLSLPARSASGGRKRAGCRRRSRSCLMTSLSFALCFYLFALGQVLSLLSHRPHSTSDMVVFFSTVVAKTTGDVRALPVGGAERKMVKEARRRGFTIAWRQKEHRRMGGV